MKEILSKIRIVLTAFLLLLCSKTGWAEEKFQPYHGYTGTVHQFGFIGGLYNTLNPNYNQGEEIQTFHDFGLGIIYNLHDYVTRQFTFDVISSLNVVTAEYLEMRGYDDKKKKIIWPVDCRFFLGPSEDFQAFLGVGVQWNMFEKNTGPYSLTSGTIPTKSIHQLSGNTAIGFNFLGPQKFMVHFNLGAKFHFAIANNDETKSSSDIIDLSQDRSCIVLNGGITVDLDKRKNASLMLNYEYPLGTPTPLKGDYNLFKNTQTFSFGIVFHIGGSR